MTSLCCNRLNPYQWARLVSSGKVEVDVSSNSHHGAAISIRLLASLLASLLMAAMIASSSSPRHFV